MRIEEVVRECVVALFADPELRRPVVLKGGTALRLSEKMDNRLSTDIDFSIPDVIAEPEQYFRQVGLRLANHFEPLGFEVIDGKPTRKPKTRGRNLPPFWGGWSYQFKLSDLKNRGETPGTKTRRALIPGGSASSRIELEFSEHEYCGSLVTIKIAGSPVRVYSSVLLILEKIRAICQQHPSYPYTQNRDRVRDFYDIYQLVRKHRAHPKFFSELKLHIGPVFEAKQVPLTLLDAIFAEDFLELQESGFPALGDTVTGKLQPFYFYTEQLKWLIGKIRE